MEVVKCLAFVILYGAFALSVLVHAQNQSGFISIDCGIPEGSKYTDDITGINYVSDAAFISTGVNENISPDINTTGIDKQYWNLRSFPEGTQSCYTLKPTGGKNNKYLIRAGFLYGNYDKKSNVPRFDLYLGVNWWETVRLDDASTPFIIMIIHVLSSDYLDICLVNTGFGTPFISLLELRVLNNDTYASVSGSLELHGRWNLGSANDKEIRFPTDVHDRVWSPCTNDLVWQNLNTTSTVISLDHNNYQLPSIVMETAVTPSNNSYPLHLFAQRYDSTSQFYFYLHFAEIIELGVNQSREFNIYINEELWYGPVIPKYLQTTTINSTSSGKGTKFDLKLNKTENSTLPPLINAFEVYYVKEFLQSETYQEDVDAIMNIKSTYGVKRYWQGDPCLPKIAIWDGLNCSYADQNPPRIISLDLSFSGLTGQISTYISHLRMIQYLDLSNNELTGPMPKFLSQLPNLRVLNLSENSLSGSVPPELLQRQKNGTLILNVHNNRNLCSADSCKKKLIVPISATIGAVFSFLLTAGGIIWSLKRRKHGEANDRNGALKFKGRHFAYSEILKITNNLERTVGNGKLGTIYHGYLDDTQVAVKIFSPPHVHDYRQFHSSARLLTRVHHRNLTSCFGYCDDDSDKGLIYEYMVNGNLEDVLSCENSKFLSWQERLQMAMDVAQGLEFLHRGCRPSIIHGNLKPANILLNENFQAKLVDFGLSKVFTIEGGTTEYLDPEYYVTNKLTEKSDVFSFGVVLLAIITSQPAIANNQDRTSIVQWVNSLLDKGDINSIIDPRLQGDVLIDSVWKAVELAMACVSPISMQRPTITQVLMELNQCLAMEITRITKTERTIELVSVNVGSELSLQAR